MAKEIIFSDNARNRLFAGVEKLADAVKVFLYSLTSLKSVPLNMTCTLFVVTKLFTNNKGK